MGDSLNGIPAEGFEQGLQLSGRFEIQQGLVQGHFEADRQTEEVAHTLCPGAGVVFTLGEGLGVFERRIDSGPREKELEIVLTGLLESRRIPPDTWLGLPQFEH